VTQQAGFDVFDLERALEKRIFQQVDLANRQVISGAPIGVYLTKQIGGQGLGHARIPSIQNVCS